MKRWLVILEFDEVNEVVEGQLGTSRKHQQSFQISAKQIFKSLFLNLIGLPRRLWVQ